MSVDPQQHRILLVGPRVVHLKPFFERRRYQCVAVQKGVEGMTALDAEPRDIVILELNLGDLTATEFLMAARQAHAQASFLLLDDASKAGQIVKALQAGLDGYLPTPPDEDRLFFEVERHLSHSAGGGLNGNTGETLLTKRPQDFTDLQTQLADRESQLVELGMQNDLLQQEIGKARDMAKVFASVKLTLGPILEGDLDAEQAVRLKERLAMATVLETEVDALREELGGSRGVRRELQDTVDTLRKKLAAAEASAEAAADEKNTNDSIEGAALKDRASELEADNMVMAGRVAELEEELDLSRAEVVALEQKHKAEYDDLRRELNRISSENADSTRASMEHAETVAKLEDDHKLSIVRLREETEAAVKRAKEEADAEKARIDARVNEAIKKREREMTAELAKREREMAGDAKQSTTALESQLLAVMAEREQAVEKALDIELMLDELKTKISFLEGEVQKAQERARTAEDAFKKDKLRLIEEKEVAASGSAEAFEKVQKYIDENAVLKRANGDFEAMRSTLEEKARVGEEATMNAALQLEQAAIIRAEAITQRDTAESARRATEDRAANLEKKAAQLEAALEEERGRVAAAERAMGEVGQAANRLADANAARAELEKEAERLGGKLADAESALMRMGDELENSKKTGVTSDAHSQALKDRITRLEENLAERAAAEREAKETLVALQGEIDEQRKTLTEHYEQRLKDAVQGNPGAASDALAERDAYRQRLAETEAWVQQAQLHLEALRVERDQLAAQATALSNNSQTRAAESQELYAQLATAKQQVEQLTGRAAGLEQDLIAARQQAERASAQSVQLQTEMQMQPPKNDDQVRALERQIQQLTL
ncbi:MAG TPA: hypothetical protein VGO62_16965, partial [Myxococcota bacterium]